VFTRNRDRLLEAEVAKLFLAEVVEQAWEQGFTSNEHFTVDGTLLEAWAGAKSFQRKEGKNPPPTEDDPGNPTVNFQGERRSNRTPESKTDPEAKLARKSEGKEAKLSYSGNLLMENRQRAMPPNTSRIAFGVVLSFRSCITSPTSSSWQYQLDRSPRSRPIVSFG
jgi:hypothetical protein